jgi:hypothetical protein
MPMNVVDRVKELCEIEIEYKKLKKRFSNLSGWYTKKVKENNALKSSNYYYIKVVAELRDELTLLQFKYEELKNDRTRTD